MNWTKEQIDATLRTLVERSMTDAAFRALALKDAKAAIRAVAGVDVESNVRFVDNAGADLTVVLPDPMESGQVSEQELAGVAGGGILDTITQGADCQASLLCGNTLTFCSPLYTRKPNSPTLCPH